MTPGQGLKRVGHWRGDLHHRIRIAREREPAAIFVVNRLPRMTNQAQRELFADIRVQKSIDHRMPETVRSLVKAEAVNPAVYLVTGL
jgi:hypothetical protein